MASVTAWQDLYRRMIIRTGTTVQIKRGNGTPVSVRGRVFMTGITVASISELTDTIGQRRPTAIILAEDLDGSAFSVPPIKGDRLIHNTKTFMVTEVDDMTRSVEGERIAYVLILVG